VIAEISKRPHVRIFVILPEVLAVPLPAKLPFCAGSLPLRRNLRSDRADYELQLRLSVLNSDFKELTPNVWFGGYHFQVKGAVRLA
jgi:hypothetical protein